jgi:hypothetical protein
LTCRIISRIRVFTGRGYDAYETAKIAHRGLEELFVGDQYLTALQAAVDPFPQLHLEIGGQRGV